MKKLNIKEMTIIAVLIAIHVVISTFYIQVFDNTRIMFTFIISALVGVIGGPLWSVIFAFCADTIAFMVHPFGAYFFGYTLTTIVTCLIYALGFYKKRLSIARIAITKTLVNVICNIMMNSFWSYLLYSNGYLYYLGQQSIKNLILLPIEIAVLVVVFKMLLPILKKKGYVNQSDIKFF